MILRIGDKILELTDDDLEYMYVDEGMEGTIYRLGDMALKVYDRFSNKARLEEDEALKLSEIDTDRILLPRELIYDEDDNFKGYTTKFLTSYNFKNLGRMPIKEFSNEIGLIYKDINTLTNHNVDVDDYTLSNIILSDGLYLVDPGSYMFVNEERFLLSDNRYRFNHFLIDSVIPYGVKMTKKEIKNLRNYFDASEDLVDYINYEADKKDTVKSFVKRITR